VAEEVAEVAGVAAELQNKARFSSQLLRSPSRRDVEPPPLKRLKLLPVALNEETTAMDPL
jgi:hypothetical protein